MSPDGTPVQVNASALQAAGTQNSMGIFKNSNVENQIYFSKEFIFYNTYNSILLKFNNTSYQLNESARLTHLWIFRKHCNCNVYWWKPVGGYH